VRVLIQQDVLDCGIVRPGALTFEKTEKDRICQGRTAGLRFEELAGASCRERQGCHDASKEDRHPAFGRSAGSLPRRPFPPCHHIARRGVDWWCGSQRIWL